MVFLLFLLSLSFPGFEAWAADPRSSARFYVETYGLVDSVSDPRVDRAQAIFKRLLKVSNRPSDIRPGLRVIDSEGQPWAIALPDGYVIISSGTLDVCYGDVSKDVGDSRLALILGHELTHLSQNDFWHRDVHLTLKEQPGAASEELRQRIAAFAGVTDNIDIESWQEQVRHRELIADDQGFLFASLAGYSTSQLLDPSQGNLNFFDYWVQNTRQGVDELHADPVERGSLLSARFNAVREKVELFDNGVRLLTLGRLDDAISFFRAFTKAYPAAAVNSNLGFTYLHKAFQSMHPDDATRFWLPGMVDTLNPLMEYRYLGQSESSRKIREYLETAVAYLDKAAETDPDHLASRINLSTAHWYLGNFHKARAVVEEARRLEPDNPTVLSLRALILQFQEQEIDMWPVSTGILKSLVGLDPTPLPALFNLARLMEQRSRMTQAMTYWAALQDQMDKLPSAYRQVVCAKTQAGTCDRYEVPDSRSRITETLFGGAVVEKIQGSKQHWRTRSFDVDTLSVTILDNGAGLQLLELDEHAEIVIVRPEKRLELSAFEQLVGSPLAIWPTARGEVRIYPGQIVSAVENSAVVRAWWGET